MDADKAALIDYFENRLREAIRTCGLPQRLKVTVCDNCLMASCWQGKFFCEKHFGSGTVDLPVSRLKKLAREHPSYWENDPRVREWRTTGKVT